MSSHLFFQIVSPIFQIGAFAIEYQVKLQIVSLSLQMAVFGETPVSPFLQIGIKVSANPVSPFLQIQYHRFCKSSITDLANRVSGFC